MSLLKCRQNHLQQVVSPTVVAPLSLQPFLCNNIKYQIIKSNANHIIYSLNLGEPPKMSILKVDSFPYAKKAIILFVKSKIHRKSRQRKLLITFSVKFSISKQHPFLINYYTCMYIVHMSKLSRKSNIFFVNASHSDN